MNTSHTDTSTIRPFTRFMWWVAGAENTFLVKYPTEYAKYSIIGAVICMTFLVAFASGFSAAYYFSEKVSLSIIFGIFWGAVIFCIDRALVVTMKKKLSDSKTIDKIIEISKILVPRCLLAVLVAFIMSIPLELLMFEDLIQQELPSYKEEKLLRAQNSGYHASSRENANTIADDLRKDSEVAEKRLHGITGSITQCRKEISNLESQISTKKSQINKPSSPKYNSARNKANALRSQLAHTDRNNSTYKQIQSELNTQNSIMKSEMSAWNKTINDEIKNIQLKITPLKAQLSQLENDQKEAHLDYTDISKRKRDATKRVQDIEHVMDSTAASIGSQFENSNKFIQYYSVLDYAVTAKHKETIMLHDGKEITVEKLNNPEALTLLWLVRVLFFIFEMMPTVVKAISKPGPYEYEVEAYNQSVKDYLISDSYRNEAFQQMQAKMAHERQLAADRQATEKNLHDKLLKKIMDAQEEIGNIAIENWKKNQKKIVSSYDMNNSQVNNSYPQNNTISLTDDKSDNDTETINIDEWD